MDKASGSTSRLQTKWQNFHSAAIAFALFLMAPLIGRDALTGLQVVTACFLAASLVANSLLAFLLLTDQITDEMLLNWRPLDYAQLSSLLLTYWGMALSFWLINPFVAGAAAVAIVLSYPFAQAVFRNRKRERAAKSKEHEVG
jgi:hypothetical protein